VIPGPDVKQDVSCFVYDLWAGERSGYGSGCADRGWVSIEFGRDGSTLVSEEFWFMKDCDEVTVLMLLMILLHV